MVPCCTFNNANLPGSKYSVITGTGDHPAASITWYSAVRFANWMNNGQGNGDTESGAYILQGGTTTPSNADSIVREAGAKIFIPSENEWYKAAYYDPRTTAQGGPPSNSHYWLYPTTSNATPTATGPLGAPPNSANSQLVVGNLTNVGAYTLTMSPSGAFDMGGDVYQWNEALTNPGSRGLRGGSWQSEPAPDTLISSNRDPAIFATVVYENTGFRLAETPEPSTGVLAVLACGMMWWWRKRFK